jgi:large subunit ribosomal protein L29
MSKQAEAIRTLRDMTDDELAEHLRQQRRRLFELRFQQATGQVENHRQIRDTRREIARTMTVQIEIARGVVIPERAAPAPAPTPSPARRRRARSESAPAEPVDDVVDEQAASEQETPEQEAPEQEAPPVSEPEPVEAPGGDERTGDEEELALSETEPSPEEVDPDE